MLHIFILQVIYIYITDERKFFMASISYRYEENTLLNINDISLSFSGMTDNEKNFDLAMHLSKSLGNPAFEHN